MAWAETGKLAVSDYLDASTFLDGNSGTNTTTAVQALQDAWTTAKKPLYWPPGTYLIPPNILKAGFDGATMFGAGRSATILQKTDAGTLFDASGTGTGDDGHRYYVTLADMKLVGDDNTGPLVKAYYTTTLSMYRVWNFGNADIALDTVELWDSRFVETDWEWCGLRTGTGGPAVSIVSANSAAASDDSPNALRFFGCRFETFFNQALSIDSGTGTGAPHDIVFYGTKVETGQIRGGFIHVGSTVFDVHFYGLYCYAGSFATGYSTRIDMIDWQPQANSTLDGVFLGSGGDFVARGVNVNTSGPTVLRNIGAIYDTAPSSGHVVVSGNSAGLDYSGIWTNLGTSITGLPATYTPPVLVIPNGGTPPANTAPGTLIFEKNA